MVETDTHILFLILLGLFSTISLALACYSLANVIRLRNVRLSWKAGNIKGYPLFSSLFLGFTIIGIAVSFYNESSQELVISGLYLLLAVGWFITSFFSSKRYITDHGIVKNVNDPSQTIAWFQIRDFVEKREDGYVQFLFIYTPENEDNPENLIRLEINVPDEQLAGFTNLISHKLGRRISCYTGETVKLEQFD